MLKTKNPILIICNGKSTGQIDWEWLKQQNIDTFGMNNAYKMYAKLDFYPTYYACLDDVVIQSHEKKIQELMRLNRIKRLFLHSACKFEDHNTYQPVKKTPPFSTGQTVSFDNFFSWMNTGADAVQISLMLGYKQIYLIGVDGYVEIIKEAQRQHGIVFEITETPQDNPNYWFSDYQEKGDRYNLPNAQKVHKPGWKKAWQECQKNHVKIFNLSLSDYIDIPKLNYTDFTRKLTKNL